MLCGEFASFSPPGKARYLFKRDILPPADIDRRKPTLLSKPPSRYRRYASLLNPAVQGDKPGSVRQKKASSRCRIGLTPGAGLHVHGFNLLQVSLIKSYAFTVIVTSRYVTLTHRTTSILNYFAQAVCSVHAACSFVADTKFNRCACSFL